MIQRRFQIHTGTKYLNARWRKPARAEGSAPASCLSVTLHLNTPPVIRKIAKEAVSPSLSSFEGHFAAQRQTPNALPLPQRAGLFRAARHTAETAEE